MGDNNIKDFSIFKEAMDICVLKSGCALCPLYKKKEGEESVYKCVDSAYYSDRLARDWGLEREAETDTELKAKLMYLSQFITNELKLCLEASKFGLDINKKEE